MSLHSLRRTFQRNHRAKIGQQEYHWTWANVVMGIMLVAMCATAFSWNGLNRNPGPSAQANTNASDADATVAKVDGMPVKRSEYDDQVTAMKNQMFQGGNSMSAMEMGFLRAMTFQQIVRNQEMIEAAKKMGITVSDSDIDSARNKFITEMNLRKQLGLPASASLQDVEGALAQYNKSIDDIPQLGKAALTNDVIMQKAQDTIEHRVVVSEQDARDSFKKYRTEHILIENKSRSDVQAQARAKEVLAKALAPGANFEALAKQYSDDKGTAAKGGDDGWIDQSTKYVDEFKNAAFALKPGEVTPDLVTSPQYGYFIIKLVAEQDNVPPDFDKNKATTIASLTKQRQQDAWQKFQQDATTGNHDVEVLDPGIRAEKEMGDARDAGPQGSSSVYAKAVTDFNAAIKATNDSEDRAIYEVELAEAYQFQKDTPDELKAYAAATKDSGNEDTQLDLSAGDAYKAANQFDKALPLYQAASQNAWDQEYVHKQLIDDFKAIGHEDLSIKEAQWVSQYDLAHPQKNTATASVVPQQPAKQQVLQTIAVRNGKVISATPGPIKVTQQPAKPQVLQTIAVRNGKVISATPGPVKVTPTVVTPGTATPGSATKPAQ